MTCQEDAIAPLKLVELKPLLQGDTWGGIAQIQVLFNTAPPPSPLTQVDMHFRRTWSDFVPAYKLSSVSDPDQGDIIIASAANWFISIPSQALPLDPDVWLFDIKFTAQDGTVLTPVGGTLTVVKKITR